MSRLSNTLLTALTPLIWGSTYLVTSEWLPADHPFTAACIRTLPAGLLLLLWSRQGLRVPRREWGRLALLSLLNIGCFQALLFVAAYRLPGGIAAIVGATMPLLVMTLHWLFDDRRPSALATLAALAAVGGMTLIFGRSELPLDPVGLAAAAGGTGCLAAGTYLSRRWTSRTPLLVFTGWQLLLGGLVLAPLALALESPLTSLTIRHLAGFAYLCLFGAVLGYPLWFRGIAKLSPTAVAALGLLSPLTAVTLGWTVLGESLSVRASLGMGVVLVAVLLLQWALRPRPSFVQSNPPILAHHARHHPST